MRTTVYALLFSIAFVACAEEGKKRPLGATCDDSAQCESGLCMGGICVDPNSLGDTDTSPDSDVSEVTEPPVAVVSIQPAAVINNELARFEFTSEPVGAAFECVLDGAEPVPCTSPYEVTVGEGPHTMTIIARWPDGTVDPNPPTFTWTVDLTAPVTTLGAAPPAYDNSVEVELTFTANETATFECRLDAGPFESCVSPWTIGPLSDGSHTVLVRATDGAGNVEEPAQSHTWVVDTSTPDTSIDDGPEGDVSATDAQFIFSTTASPSPTFECALDEAAFAACTSPQVVAALDEGEHTFQVRAQNVLGIVDPTPAFRTWVVDTTPPVVLIVDGPSGFTAQATPTFAFSVEGEPLVIECRIDDEDFAPCTSPYLAAALTDGDHTFEVRAFDAAGNEDSDIREFILDTTFPTVTIELGPEGPTNNASPTFTFTSTSSVGAWCSVDSAPTAPCVSPVTVGPLVDGPHTIEVFVENAAGTGASASRAFVVDLVVPALTLTGGPTGPTNVNPPPFPFDAEVGVTVECRVDAQSFEPCTTPFSPDPLSDGPHTFEVRATDPAGNVTTLTRSFSIDTTAPTLSITAGPSSATRINPPTFQMSLGADAATVECRVDDDVWVTCGASWTTPPLADGDHTFEVRAADTLGNLVTTSRTFAIDTVAPTLGITSGPNGPTADNAPTFAFNAANDAAVIECRLDAAAFMPCTSPYEPVASLVDGPHTFDVRVSDAVGNVASASRTFSVDTTPPTVGLTGGPSGPTATNPPTFTFNFGNDAVTIECRVDTGGFGACTSPHTTVSLPQGARTFEVRVSDALGNQATVSRAFSIDTVAPTLAITAGPSGPTNTNPPTFSFTTGADATVVQCRIGAAAFANCASPWSPAALGQGNHTFEVRVADSLGNQDTASRAFSIDTTAPTLTITTGPTSATNVNPPSFTFVYGPDATTIECRLGAAAFAACTSPFAPAVLAQGPHTFEVRVADSLGNQTNASRSFSIDTVAPTVSITAGPNGPTGTNPPTFGFTAGADAVSTECRVDTGAFAACTSPHTTAVLPQGGRTFEVRVTDAVGNQATVSRGFTIDTTPPVVTIVSGPDGTTNVNPPTFGFTTGADAGTIQCRIDTAAFANCTTSYTPAALSQGPHTFEVRVADAIGNTATASRAFTIDTLAPPVSITAGPNGPTNVNPATFTFTVGGGATIIQCRVDTGAFANCTSPYTTATLGQGPHTFEVRASDALGNAATASRSFNVDTVAPTLTITAGPTGPTATNPPTFTFTAGADATTIECRVDTTAFGNCTTPYTTGTLGQGAHTFEVRASDALGNQVTTSRAFSIDTLAPTVSITNGPSGPTNTNPPSFEFTRGADATTVQCRIDTAAFANCTSPYVSASLAQGDHTFEVRVADSLGNQATASRDFTIDTVAPTLSITGGPTGPTAENPTKFFFAAGADASTIQCRVDTAAFANCTSPYTTPTLSQNAHLFEVRVADSLGNQASATRSFSTDTVGPTLAFTSGPTGPTNVNPPTFGFTVGDAVTVECQVDQGAFTACTSPRTTGQLSQGNHTFSVRGKDTLGNESLITRAFSIDTSPPTLTITGGPTGPTNINPPSFTFTYGADATTIQCRIDTAAFANCTSGWSPTTLGQGNHTFEVRVSDAVGNTATQTRTFSIDTVAPTLSIIGGPSGPTSNGSPSFEFVAGADAVTVECRLDTAVFAACQSPTSYIRLSQGAHTFQVRAADALGNSVTVSRSFDVDNIGPNVTITSGPSGATNSNPPSWKFTVGADAVAIRCRIDNAAYVPCQGDYSPSTLTQGPHVFRVEAEDDLGNTNFDSRSFSIDTVPPTLVITSGPSGLVNTNPNTFRFTAGADATSVQCRTDTGAWTTCASSYTTATLSQGAHTFDVRAYDALGNVEVVSRSFTVDTIAPTVTITSGPANNSVISQNTVTFTFTTSGATTVQCRLYVEGNLPPSFASCTSPFTRNIGYFWYFFQVRGLDAAGNVTTVTRYFGNGPG